MRHVLGFLFQQERRGSLTKRNDRNLAPTIGICSMCGAPVRKESERIGIAGTSDVVRRRIGVLAAIGNVGHAGLYKLMAYQRRKVEAEAAILIVDKA